MNRLCATLAGIVACCVLMSHSGYAAQSKGIDSAQQATMSSGSYAPFEVGKISVDTVGLGVVSTVSIRVRCWPKQVKNVTARIVPDSGYEIVLQPQETYTEPDTATGVFKGMIRATANGIWKVGVAATGAWPDTTRSTVYSDFYIQISDSLCRFMTDYEYRLSLPTGPKKALKLPKDAIILHPLPPGPRTKPRKQESDSSGSKMRSPKSGYFNVTGYLYYHDARDPQGQYRPAINVATEVWNDGQYDTPPSTDVLLGTETTDWDGSFSLYGLDNSDPDGTADPYIIWRTENDTWRVIRPIPGTVYAWYSSVIFGDVADNATVDFGSSVISGGQPNDEDAMWCFQYMNLGWGEAYDAGSSTQFVDCTLPATSTQTTLLGDAIFIESKYAQAIDAVNHEYGHCLMLQPYSNGVIWGCNPTGINAISCPSTAWREGWATFFPLVVTPDGVMDYDTAGAGIHFPIETPQWNPFQQGPAVPGRVAGALLDLWDTSNDGLDQNSANTITLGTLLTWGVRSHTDSSFWKYWSNLRNDQLSPQQIALGLQSIKNNTIDFTCTSCGDSNGDGSIDISDAVFLIAHIFTGGRAPGDCNYAKGKGDANGDGNADISDVVYLIARIFSGGPAPHCQDM